MADTDLTIVILRNIQTEMAGFRQPLETLRKDIDDKFLRVDDRLHFLSTTVVQLANQLGIDTESNRHRIVRHEGTLAELSQRVTALENLVKPKPTE